MRNLDFSSWQAMLFSFVGIALVTLIGVVIRLVVMQSVQQRRDRENRQINERLRALIAAYKALGGSFTGSLEVDPQHKRDLKDGADTPGGERARRIRDAVEAALSDIILLGTERRRFGFAALAASQLCRRGRATSRPRAGRLASRLHSARHSTLRTDPAGLAIPRQGPTRIIAKGGKDDGGKDEGKGGGVLGGGMGGERRESTSVEARQR